MLSGTGCNQHIHHAAQQYTVASLIMADFVVDSDDDFFTSLLTIYMVCMVRWKVIYIVAPALFHAHLQKGEMT